MDSSKIEENSNNGILSCSHIMSKSGSGYSMIMEVRNMASASSLPISSNNITRVSILADSDSLAERILTEESNNHANFSKIIQSIRIIGLMALVSYMAIILFTWIYANLAGNVYFIAGEPSLYLKYSEWLLGFTGIFVALDGLRREMRSS